MRLPLDSGSHINAHDNLRRLSNAKPASGRCCWAASWPAVVTTDGGRAFHSTRPRLPVRGRAARGRRQRSSAARSRGCSRAQRCVRARGSGVSARTHGRLDMAHGNGTRVVGRCAPVNRDAHLPRQRHLSAIRGARVGARGLTASPAPRLEEPGGPRHRHTASEILREVPQHRCLERDWLQRWVAPLEYIGP
jgi:hypothetical protein